MKKAKYFITCGELTNMFSGPTIGINEIHPDRLRPMLLSDKQKKEINDRKQLSFDFDS